MLRRSRSILGAVSVLLPALSLLALTGGRDACAQTVTLTNTRGLDFGRFVANTGGTVTVPTSGARTSTLGVILLNSPSSAPSQFSVVRSKSGGAIKSVTITLPANGSVQLTSGGNSMAVNNFVCSPATLSTISTTPTTLTVGATLSVAANQPAGSYAGSFPLIVNYQ